MGQQASAPRPGTELQVIGAGLSRTGTASFSAALEILLESPIYHGGTQQTMGSPVEIKTWNRLLRAWLAGDRATTLSLLRERTAGYAAITDAPGSHLVPELLELYPNSKVIVTVRDRDAWVKSMEQIASLSTLWFLRAVLLPLPGMRHFVTYISLVRAQWDRIYDGDRVTASIYERHIAWLKEIVPADRLVFFDVRDGWEPLCQALGKEVPKDILFPRINDSKAVDRVAEYHIKRGLGRWAVALTAVGALAAWWYLMGLPNDEKRRSGSF
ncbi:sulfotransferase family protein [Aspergillus homomorphus CBS 101889]|uniref:Putative NAD dependent epimerase/dehydratase n=1 Tax=Aspergillus homomorphus (strain CBS 101889) TaxID=1450537 RepID=A0A395I115_ASPHC|nr:putative NAD dependent epimerase/dehydratase [Aspergillus homomorphus CBS 101889]RAL13892.1 putative NAD dependent epimerase/dehydratase [Aspergillus homomorphus CBS 101889]